MKIIDQCILRLSSQPEDEESLECLCLLLSTVGKELETRIQLSGGSGMPTSTLVCYRY